MLYLKLKKFKNEEEFNKYKGQKIAYYYFGDEHYYKVVGKSKRPSEEIDWGIQGDILADTEFEETKDWYITTMSCEVFGYGVVQWRRYIPKRGEKK